MGRVAFKTVNVTVARPFPSPSDRIERSTIVARLDARCKGFLGCSVFHLINVFIS